MLRIRRQYDPSWLVNAVKALEGEYPWIVEAAQNCTSVVAESELYIHFIDPSNPNKPGSKWQFEQNIIIEESEKGELVLDILKGNIIGGVELLTNVMKGV